MRKPSMAYFFDTVTLSNFALIGQLDLLIQRYGQRLKLTHEVLTELAEGIIAGFGSLRTIEAAIDDGLICRADPFVPPASRKTYSELLRVLGPVEASCIIQAIAHGGVVVSDDRTARRHCAEQGIPVTGTIGILKACWQDGSITADEADEMLSKMIEAGFHSPVQSIVDL